MDAADATPIANATLELHNSFGVLTSRTDAHGSYTFDFSTSQPYRHRNGTVPGPFLGLLVATDGGHWGDIRAGHWTTLQGLPWGVREVVHNVRLRPVRTLAAGQSMHLSIDPDSSLAWDRDWDPWFRPDFDTLREAFFVSVHADGLLTIDARPQAGGIVPGLTCQYVGCPNWQVQGTVSLRVEARWSPLYFNIEIPRASAPQRYEIQTSLR